MPNINLTGVEATANKSTNVNTDQASNTKYPSVKAVFDWAVSLFHKKSDTTIDLQSDNKTDYSKGWCYGDDTSVEFGFGSNSQKIDANRSLTTINNSLALLIESATDKFYKVRTTDGAKFSELKLNPTANSIFESTELKPLDYNADYSANYSNRSLVDKEYVDVNLPVSNNGYRKYGTTTFERWYVGNGNCSALSTIGIGRNNIQYIPLIVGKRCTLASVGVDITTAGSAGSLMTISLYSSINNLPDTRIVDCGALLVDSIAVVKIIGLSTVLTPGLYWFAINHNSTSTVTMRAIPVAGCEPILGFGNTLGSVPGTFYSNTSNTYTTSLPVTAVTPTTVGTVAPPAIYFYLSA